MFGGNGNDSVWGNSGDDFVADGLGDDTLKGDAGNVVLIGRVGADKLVGGFGSDTADYSGSNAAVQVDLGWGWGKVASGGDAEGDRLYSVENVIGTSFDDELFLR